MRKLRVFPKVFQVIISPCLGQEDVNHHVRVIHRHPISIGKPHYVYGLLARFHPRRFLNRVGYGLNLRGGVALTDYEIPANRAFNAAKVGNCDV